MSAPHSEYLLIVPQLYDRKSPHLLCTTIVGPGQQVLGPGFLAIHHDAQHIITVREAGLASAQGKKEVPPTNTALVDGRPFHYVVGR